MPGVESMAPGNNFMERQGTILQKCCQVVKLVVPPILILLTAEGLLQSAGPTLAIQTGAGITVGGAHPTYSGSIGNVNGLGVGTPGSGVSLITSGVGNAVFYYTPYNYNVSSLNGSATGTVTAYVSTNFAHPAILTVYTCTSGCTSFGSYGVMSTNSAAPNTLVAGAANNTTSTAYIGVLISNANGASAFSGADSVTISFTLTNNNNGQTDTVTLGTSVNLQTALSLTLSTAGGGLTVSAASDYCMNFGNVNGLGINPAAGLTTAAATGGYLYSTPYVMTPKFSSFTTTSGTLKVYISTNFVHTAVLQLQDSATSGGTYSAISTNSGGQTSISTSATTGSSVMRYLGLWVSNANGASAYTGADNATLTYSLTVP
jgi:hypothetical protein